MVPPLRRYYEALRSPDSRLAALRFLRLAIPRSARNSSPFGPRRLGRRIIPEFAVPVAPEPVFFEELSGPPKFPGNPRDHSPCSSTPARPDLRVGTSCQQIRQGPRIEAQRRLSTNNDFGAQSHGIWSGCLRLVVEVARHHARLASGHWPPATGRDSHPQSSDERFPNVEILPPFLSILALASFV
jgi:hypothetical protein